MTEDPDGLERLTARLRRDLAAINYPPDPWTPAADDRLDALVIGAGQMGLAASFALMRRGLSRHRVVDAAPVGREGPWRTYARMQTLRSPKHLVGPAQDMSALTFRAWHGARFGDAAWDALVKIPTTMWQDYLDWFRDVLALPVENGLRLTALEPAPGGLAATLDGPGGPRRVLARRVVLATGRDGMGGPHRPAWAPEGVDPRVIHSTEPLDAAALRGLRVAVIGCSASAFDNAAAALDAGAAEAHMIMRRPRLPRFNRFKSMVHPGFDAGFPRLPDALRLAFLEAGFDGGVAPPWESVALLRDRPGFTLHAGTEVRAMRCDPDALTLDLGDATLAVDRVILGTGFAVDPARRPELATLAPAILQWRDRPDTPPGSAFARHPYLGPDFAFTARDPAEGWVSRVHALNIGAMASLGLLSGDIPGVGAAAARLADGIAGALFAEDAAAHLEAVRAYDTLEIAGDELDAALARQPADA